MIMSRASIEYGSGCLVRAAARYPGRALTAAWIVLLAGNAQAYFNRPGLIPNGSVFNCQTCHISASGGRNWNSFGLAVQALGVGQFESFWDPSLAGLDSDGDGFSNGEELGDPDGDFANVRTTGITNPGDANSKPTPQPPSAPTATAASAVTVVGFTANWTGASGATGYRLDVSSNNVFSTFVSGLQDLDVGNTTSRLVQGLNPGTPYFYRVRAYNAGGTSGSSSTVSATTPTLVLAARRSGNAVVISWTADASGFQLRSSGNVPGTTWDPVSPAPTLAGAQLVVTNSSPAGDRLFYRLQR
jgi:hypothetical protein